MLWKLFSALIFAQDSLCDVLISLMSVCTTHFPYKSRHVLHRNVLVSDCRFGVSPVNYPDPGTWPAASELQDNAGHVPSRVNKIWPIPSRGFIWSIYTTFQNVYMHAPLPRFLHSKNHSWLSYKSVMKKRYLSSMKHRDLIYFIFSVAAMVDIRLCVHLPSATVTGFARKSSSVLKCVVK